MIDNIDNNEIDEEINTSSKEIVRQQFQRALDVLLNISPNKEQVKYYNSLVLERLKDFNNFPILLNLLIYSNNDNARICLIISFISHYLKVQSKMGVGIIRHKKKHIYQKLKMLFFCQSLNHKHKRMLLRSFSQFISTLSYEFSTIRKHLCEQIVDFFYKQKQQLSATFLVSTLYLLQAVITPNLQTENLKMLLDNLLVNFLRICLRMFRQINQCLLNKHPDEEFTFQQKKKIQWTQRVHLIFWLLFKSADNKNNKFQVLKMNVVISTQFAHYCDVGLKMTNRSNTIILNCKINKTNAVINQIKKSVFSIMLDSFTFLLYSRKQLANPKYIPIAQTGKMILQYIVPKLEQQIQGLSQKQLLSLDIYKQALLVLAKVAKYPIFYAQLDKIKDIVFFKLCLPCLVSSQEEKKINAEDFCRRRQQLVDCDMTRNVPQAACRVLQSYSDQVYGTIPYLINSLINLMDFQLTANPLYYEQIPNSLIQTSFFKNCNFYGQMQTCLSIFTLFIYHVDDRDDIAPKLQQFIVRRQQFFSRIDTSPEVIVSFLQCCSFYLSNFFQLILQGKANSDFHRSLIFHSLELLDASLDPNTKQYRSNDYKKIGLQAMDYIGNAVINQLFYSAIFPAWNERSTQLLVKMTDKLCKYLDYTCNYTVIENILIDMYLRTIQRHYKENKDLSGLPTPIRSQLSILILNHIFCNFRQNIKHQNIAKQKMLQLYYLLVLSSSDPCSLVQLGQQLIVNLVQTEYTYIQQAIDIIQILLKRCVTQKRVVPQQLHQIIIKTLTKGIKVCSNQKFELEVFDAVMNANILKIGQYQFAVSLFQAFQQKQQEIPSNQQAEIIMEKLLYLLLQIAYSNFQLVSAQFWLNTLSKMVQYMSQHYVSRCTLTFGKVVCFCMCCYIQSPDNVQNYLQQKSQTLWETLLEDPLSLYRTNTQKKIMTLILLKLMAEDSSKKTIKDKFPQILKAVLTLVYSLYEKSEIQMANDLSDDNDSVQQSQQQKQKEKTIPWKLDINTLRKNIFYQELPNQLVLLKKLCIQLNSMDHQNFSKFVKNLPIAIKNLVTYKIMQYKQDSTNFSKDKIRTIYKAKKLENLPQ